MWYFENKILFHQVLLLKELQKNKNVLMVFIRYQFILKSINVLIGYSKHPFRAHCCSSTCDKNLLGHMPVRSSVPYKQTDKKYMSWKASRCQTISFPSQSDCFFFLKKYTEKLSPTSNRKRFNTKALHRCREAHNVHRSVRSLYPQPYTQTESH